MLNQNINGTSQKSKKIALLIDDNGIDNFVNQRLLESTGLFQLIYIFKDAGSALDFFINLYKISEHSGDILPDKVFLDLNMPNINGFQFLEEFKNIYRKDIKETKIKILTASINTIDRERAEKHSLVSGFIVKPLTLNTIKQFT